MFTGLVQTVGRIREVASYPDCRRFVVEGELLPLATKVGASVAVDGVCLTVISATKGNFSADAAFETLSRTTLGGLGAGDAVNLEPALRVGDPLGGHLVSGHVDTVATLREVLPRGEARDCVFSMASEFSPLVAEKGSICVAGVSLTVNQAGSDSFRVGLVPHTLARTTLGGLNVGASVNVEVDLIARYVARLLASRGDGGDSSGVTLDLLTRAGFMDRSVGSR